MYQTSFNKNYSFCYIYQIYVKRFNLVKDLVVREEIV